MTEHSHDRKYYPQSIRSFFRRQISQRLPITRLQHKRSMATTSATHAFSGLNTATVTNLSISPKTKLMYQRYAGKAIRIFNFLDLACSPLISRSYAFELHHDHDLCRPPLRPNGPCPFCQANNALAALVDGTQIFGGFSPQSGKASSRSSTDQTPPPSLS